jgi:hypothetical protein
MPYALCPMLETVMLLLYLLLPLLLCFCLCCIYCSYCCYYCCCYFCYYSRYICYITPLKPHSAGSYRWYRSVHADSS